MATFNPKGSAFKDPNFDKTGGNTAPRAKGGKIGLKAQKKQLDYERFGSGPAKSTGTTSGSKEGRRNPGGKSTFMNG